MKSKPITKPIVTTLTFGTVLEVPKAWQKLLNIEAFSDLKSLPKKSNSGGAALDKSGNVKSAWPHPLRDDSRTVSFKEAGHTVALQLLSGNENYWTTARVTLPDGRELEADEAGFDVSEEEAIEIPGNFRYVWKQQLV